MNAAQPPNAAGMPGRQPSDGPAAAPEADRTMGPAPASAADIGRAAAGEVLEVAFRVTACHRDWIAGTIVERDADGTYRITGTRLSVAWPAGVPVFMGTADDITPAAIVQAQVRVDADGRLVTRRAAILTGYVEVR